MIDLCAALRTQNAPATLPQVQEETATARTANAQPANAPAANAPPATAGANALPANARPANAGAANAQSANAPAAHVPAAHAPPATAAANALPANARPANAGAAATAATPATVALQRVEVGTWNQRFLVSLRDRARVEAVVYRGDTLCISSQVGCAVSCPFCASGQNGFGRNLSLDELVGQITSVRALGHSLRRVTVSGVGEPLHNRAVTDLMAWCSRERLGLSLTTSGGPVQRLREWLHAPHNGLTLSVHAGTEATRAKMVPHGPSLETMFGTLTTEFPKMNGRRRKKTALAYLLVNDANDADEELDAFTARAAPLGLRVHLYAYNAVDGLGFSRVSRARYESAYERLTSAGLSVSMSSQARIEANGGCGTLVALRTS